MEKKVEEISAASGTIAPSSGARPDTKSPWPLSFCAQSQSERGCLAAMHKCHDCCWPFATYCAAARSRLL